MANRNTRTIASLEKAIFHGDEVLPLLEQAKQASFWLKPIHIISALQAYSLHDFYVNFAKYAQYTELCTLENSNGFLVALFNENANRWDEDNPTLVNTFAIIDQNAHPDIVEAFTTNGYLVGFVGIQQALMKTSYFDLLNLTGSCADAIRQSYDLTAPPTPAPIGCLQIAAEVNARSHPSFDGTRLGSVSPATHGGTYFYYATQADSNSTGVNDQWYQVAPLGYGRFAAPNQAKNGHALWIRASFTQAGVTTTYLTNIQSPCPGNAMMITDIGNPVGADDKPIRDVWPDFFGDFTTDAEILAFILACESGYEIEVARDIAYVIRSRMMSDSFRNTWQNIDNTWQGVIRQQHAWQCWSDAAAVNDYKNATGARLDTVNQIKQEIVPSVVKLPVGGLGTLAFAPTNPKIEYALYTLGDALYTPEEVANYSESTKLDATEILYRLTTNIYDPITNPTGTWKPNTCYDATTVLKNMYLDHSAPTEAGLVTLYFTEFSGCEYRDLI